jgi:hypothetical protein
MSRIVVTEYPKSGASWLVGMLGDALHLPKRDIYVAHDFRVFDLTNHPWYTESPAGWLPDGCVIKSHEPPASKKLDFDASFVHLVRDGRDVVVSKYFYEKDFCVRNGLTESFDEPFEDYLVRVGTEWRDYVFSWLDTSNEFYKYESLLSDTSTYLARILKELALPISREAIECAVAANTKAKFRESLGRVFQYNTFVRKGIAGDWHNHFSRVHRERFKRVAGDALVRLRYEYGLDW